MQENEYAVEQDHTNILSQCQTRLNGQLDLEPECLVFFDKTCIVTDTIHSHGRYTKGERLRMGLPHGHRKSTTLVAGLKTAGMMAQMELDCPVNGEWFEAYVAKLFLPERGPRSLVILDNLLRQMLTSVRKRVEAVGATLAYFLPIATTLVPSKWHSHVSKLCFTRQASKPPPACGASSANSSIPASQTIVPNNSAHADVAQDDLKSFKETVKLDTTFKNTASTIASAIV